MRASARSSIALGESLPSKNLGRISTNVIVGIDVSLLLWARYPPHPCPKSRKIL
jgi:hypothetical protein